MHWCKGIVYSSQSDGVSTKSNSTWLIPGPLKSSNEVEVIYTTLFAASTKLASRTTTSEDSSITGLLPAYGAPPAV